MNIAQIETNLQKLVKSYSRKTFIYSLLLAYGLPKASISRLQKGNLNLSKNEGELSWKNKVLFREEFEEDLHVTISELASTIKHDQRFVIVTDYKTLLAIDTKTDDKLDIAFNHLPKHYDFFLPWAGMEKTQHANENPADIKAAERMAKLFDEIKKDNPDKSPEFTHKLNVFLSRILFCFFAEDTNIFADNQFTSAISSHTQVDGSDLNKYLDKLFTVLNTSKKERKNLPFYLEAFPYVNGGLFKQNIGSPKFTRRSRQAIIDSGELDWSAINPDIFGSMIQVVVTPEHRGGFGMHYTSVPNIMKVIEPLFLNDLYEAFENAKGSEKKLNDLLNRIRKIKIFDPACGSGNFLIISYKELRKLEMKILKELNVIPYSGISLSQFYGIELDDFAHEIAQLSLWLAEHQMNVEFFKEFGRTNPTLPLKEAGRIVHGNSCRIDWEKVCTKSKDSETYILGNPPYLGARLQNNEQKEDIELIFKGIIGANNLDYIACWFKKASDYISLHNFKYAFVTTNSISQGEQVNLLWPYIIGKELSIHFVHSSFKWSNSAKSNAAVIVSIIGVGNSKKIKSIIYKDNTKQYVDNINPYLIAGRNIFIQKRSKPLSNLPEMTFGSMPNDGGHLIFQKESEYASLIEDHPGSEIYIKEMFGAEDYINGVKRYCLWITDKQLKNVKQISLINNRIKEVKRYRELSQRKATNILAKSPYRFAEIRHKETDSLIIPRHSSERREYIPMGFLTSKTLIADSALAIYHAKPFHLGIVTSKIHMAWMKIVCGRIKSDYRYSSSLVYNTFPFPAISEQRKQEITQCVFRILEEREKHSDKNLAKLYDPDKMPQGLREAHHQNDLAIERCYRSKPFESDEERLEFLFKLYEQMIEDEKSKGTLFEGMGTKIKKKKK